MKHFPFFKKTIVRPLFQILKHIPEEIFLINGLHGENFLKYE